MNCLGEESSEVSGNSEVFCLHQGEIQGQMNIMEELIGKVVEDSLLSIFQLQQKIERAL